MICDLFGCTLDDLVLGDVRAPRLVPDATSEPSDGMGAAGLPEAERGICNGGLASDATSSNTAAKQSAAYGLSPNVSVGQQAVSVALPEDLTGYDAHMDSFAWKVAAGIAAIITGVAVGVLFDSKGEVSGLLARSEFLTFVCTIIGVIIGLAFLIPAGMAHSEFVRRHPFIEDFYTDDDRSRRAKELAVGVVGGIGLILLGVAVTIYGEEILGIEEGWPVSVKLLCVAAGVFCFIYFGIRYGMMNIDSYNHEAESERRERERKAQGGDFYDKLTGLVCGIIMLIATVVGLWMLFTGGPIDGGGHERWLSGNGLFWLAWPIGGILCGVATCIIQIFRSFHDRDR